MNTGQKIWSRAKKVIPGGNMLLSKRPEMFLPENWPTYFSKAKGCRVWDLDNREFIDMSTMGVGTNILGYGNEKVDNEVIKNIGLGNMSTLNCAEEVYLAEELVRLHPWAEMVRLARTGGEANAIAMRIGRAASGRDNVAVCGIMRKDPPFDSEFFYATHLLEQAERDLADIVANDEGRRGEVARLEAEHLSAKHNHGLKLWTLLLFHEWWQQLNEAP
jgi:hypothetical protein